MFYYDAQNDLRELIFTSDHWSRDNGAPQMAAIVKPSSRLQSIDALRGAIMIIMALDHTRDFFHAAAMSFSPTDLTRTYPLLFFTRWITHFCAPVFTFTAGLGAFLWLQRGRTKGQLSRFLLTRGIWLIFLDVTVMQFAYNFSFSTRFPVLLLVLWELGACMVVLAGLVQLPYRILAFLSIAVIVLHNSLDRINAASFGHYAPLWNVLHQPGAFPIFGVFVIIGYPLVPWVAVMSAGFCFGRIFLLEPATRQKIIFTTGSALTLIFLTLRATNLYGDPSRWSSQHSALFTLLSFLNCTKYPPSLLYLLMTLGPALIFLAFLDRCHFKADNPLLVFGRVPLFYFVAHFYLIHLLSSLAALLRYGARSYPILFSSVPSMGGPEDLFPANFGYPLWVVYAVWLFVVVSLYPICRRFANLKATRNDWWLSYL
jgi:uncharacterized membrane protein